MNEQACAAFRRALESALAPGTRGAEDVELGWHEHLLTCSACRASLAAEQALDALLATLPRPCLPDELAQRVLARLAQERPERPEPLDERLDRLLDLVPSPAAPGDLAARTLAELAAERRGGLRLLRGGRRGVVGRIAAAALIAVGAWWLASRGPREPGPPVVADVEDELLETLDVLENWELLTSDDLDLVLAELDAVDWTLLEFGSDEIEADAGDPADDGERGG